MERPAGRQEEMEPGIWGRLPEELLERVVALLPLRAILSLRTTCKHFNSLLLSPPFLSLLPSSPSPAAFLLLSHPQLSPRHLPVYDSAAASWRSLSLPSSSLLLCSSSSGLLCFSSSSSSPFPSLVVFNLLTGTSRTLRPPVKHVTAATLVPLASPSPTPAHGYKLFVPSSEGDFVYDSGEQSWGRFGGFDQVLLAENSPQEGVPFNGSLYFVSPEPFAVVGFDMAARRWEQLAAELPGETTFLRLVSSGAGLYLVGGVGRDGIAKSLRVWDLVGGDGDALQQWREVGRLPEMMCRKFWSACYHNYAHLHCFWHGGTVCVGCTTWPEVLQYRVGRGTWHWLPRCPMLPEKWSCGFRWFSFVPDLHALV